VSRYEVQHQREKKRQHDAQDWAVAGEDSYCKPASLSTTKIAVGIAGFGRRGNRGGEGKGEEFPRRLRFTKKYFGAAIPEREGYDLAIAKYVSSGFRACGKWSIFCGTSAGARNRSPAGWKNRGGGREGKIAIAARGDYGRREGVFSINALYWGKGSLSLGCF